MDFFTPSSLSRSADRKVRKLLGRSYLRANRLEEALEVFLGILTDYPEDVDVLLVVGNLYRASGSPATAMQLYQRVRELRSDDGLAEKQIHLLSGISAAHPAEAAPFAADSIARLVERLHAADVVESGIREAADQLDGFMANDRAAGSNPQSLRLMPALIELNVRQARAAGQTDLAEALQSLQIHLTRQASEHNGD
jgi:tetratricopeptide (TPR) repeat protein